MKQIPVIFWTGTGNTQMMADAVAEAINAAGAEAVVKISAKSLLTRLQAMTLWHWAARQWAQRCWRNANSSRFHRAGRQAGRQKVAIFGSYGWGGSYMQDWEARVKDAGATLVADGVLALGAPDDEAMAQLTEAGKLLAE